MVFLVSVHLLRTGSVQRRGPTGGLAKGIPFHARTPGTTSEPMIGPVVVNTCGPRAAVGMINRIADTDFDGRIAVFYEGFVVCWMRHSLFIKYLGVNSKNQLNVAVVSQLTYV